MTGEGGSQPPLGRLGAYELLRPIAQGGMADIYLAKKDGIGQFERHVAIKVLNKQRATEAEACAMFLDEARLVGMLNHQNIAGVLEVDVVDGHHYLAMEYVHGADLRNLLVTAACAGRAMPYEVSLAIVAGAAAGLDHAHRRCGPDGTPLRLVHRDVSLSNLMVGHDGSVKVVDFGIASTTVQTVHTSPGVVRGKASYMSPEQCLGDAVDHRTDVFALGIVLYELTTGARCFSGKTDFDRMLSVVRGDYHLPTAIVANYPVELEQVVRTALAGDPNMRYQSCTAMLDALERVARGRGWTIGSAPIARFMELLHGNAAGQWTENPAAAACTMPMPPQVDEFAAAEPTARETPSARCEAVDVDVVFADQFADHLAVLEEQRASTTHRSQRRIAQGTNAEGFIRKPEELVDDDDLPTRGRCSLTRRLPLPGVAIE